MKGKEMHEGIIENVHVNEIDENIYIDGSIENRYRCVVAVADDMAREMIRSTTLDLIGGPYGVSSPFIGLYPIFAGGWVKSFFKLVDTIMRETRRNKGTEVPEPIVALIAECAKAWTDFQPLRAGVKDMKTLGIWYRAMLFFYYHIAYVRLYNRVHPGKVKIPPEMVKDQARLYAKVLQSLKHWSDTLPESVLPVGRKMEARIVPILKGLDLKDNEQYRPLVRMVGGHLRLPVSVDTAEVTQERVRTWLSFMIKESVNFEDLIKNEINRIESWALENTYEDPSDYPSPESEERVEARKVARQFICNMIEAVASEVDDTTVEQIVESYANRLKDLVSAIVRLYKELPHDESFVSSLHSFSKDAEVVHAIYMHLLRLDTRAWSVSMSEIFMPSFAAYAMPTWKKIERPATRFVYFARSVRKMLSVDPRILAEAALLAKLAGYEADMSKVLAMHDYYISRFYDTLTAPIVLDLLEEIKDDPERRCPPDEDHLYAVMEPQVTEKGMLNKLKRVFTRSPDRRDRAIMAALKDVLRGMMINLGLPDDIECIPLMSGNWAFHGSNVGLFIEESAKDLDIFCLKAQPLEEPVKAFNGEKLHWSQNVPMRQRLVKAKEECEKSLKHLNAIASYLKGGDKDFPDVYQILDGLKVYYFEKSVWDRPQFRHPKMTEMIDNILQNDGT